jgi:hypothetical protein
MSPRDFFAQFPNHADFSRKSQVVLFAYYLRQFEGATHFSASDIKRCFRAALLKEPTDLATLMASLAKGKEARLLKLKTRRYAISLYGVNEVEAILPASVPKPGPGSSLLAAALPLLQRTIAKVSDSQRRDFLAEAISCLEVGARRATVVLSWIAALDHMQEYVFAHGLTAFNSALTKQSGKLNKLKIVTKDDFGDLKESEFIAICRSANLITNDIRKILDEKLGFRNSCAHPSSIAVGDSKVLSFVEDLVDNIIAKHSI